MRLVSVLGLEGLLEVLRLLELHQLPLDLHKLLLHLFALVFGQHALELLQEWKGRVLQI